MTTSTSGTGTITLGSASDGYQTFAASGVSNSDVVRYTIEDGNDWEIGTGTYTASGTTLSRTVTESSNSDNALNLSGSAVVFVTAAASDIPTETSLTKTFVQNEEATITLANAVSPVPTIGVFKEVPQVGVSSKGNWDVISTGANYDRFDEAPVSFSGATLTPSSATADGTFTLSSGSFASTDVGKTVEGNSGKAIITATSGTYSLVTAFANTNAIAAGSWSLYGAVPKSDGSGLELSNYVAGYQFSAGNYTINHDTGQTLTSSSQDSSINGICLGSDDMSVIMVGSTNDDVYQYDLSVAGDLSTATFNNKSFDLGTLVGSSVSYPDDVRIKPDGTKLFVLDGSGRKVYSFDLSTPNDITTASYDTVSSSTGSYPSGPDGFHIKPDGLKMWFCSTASNNIFEYNLSTAWDVSTASYSTSYQVVSSNDPSSIWFNPDGSGLYLMDDSSTDYVRKYDLSSAWDLSSLTNNGDQIFTDGDSLSNCRGIAFNSDGTYMYIGTTSKTVRYTTSDVSMPYNQYIPAVTKDLGGQINSSAWTDINSMTADEELGNGAVHYAVSTDDRTIWKVAHNTSGIRSIAKNNSGTWQYNSNATYGSETWANSTNNNELSALQQALSVTQNRMDKAQLDAVTDANHFTLGNTLDLMIAVSCATGSVAPKSDGVSINYDAATLVRQAAAGTDYEAEFPSSTSVKIKSLAAQNLKVRVI
jgi:sugar lactone lactonase YvrE